MYLTVAELIKELERFPDEARVIVPYGDVGFLDVKGVKNLLIKLDVRPDAEFYGNHEALYENEREEADEEAVLLTTFKS
jgi:hypothetical protein